MGQVLVATIFLELRRELGGCWRVFPFHIQIAAVVSRKLVLLSLGEWFVEDHHLEDRIPPVWPVEVLEQVLVGLRLIGEEEPDLQRLALIVVDVVHVDVGMLELPILAGFLDPTEDLGVAVVAQHFLLILQVLEDGRLLPFLGVVVAEKACLLVLRWIVNVGPVEVGLADK